MFAFRQHWFRKGNWRPHAQLSFNNVIIPGLRTLLRFMRVACHARLSFNNVIIPGVAGCIMVCASVLPWLNDPLGEAYTAWELPIDIGWQFRIDIFSYGLLCLCCAGYAFLVAYANWKPFKGGDYFVQKRITAGLLCLIPVALFLMQYLCIDVSEINHLYQHKIQILLVQQYFDYRIPGQLFPIKPFTLDISTLQGRLQLLIDQASVGLLLPCLSAWMLINYKWLLRQGASKKQHKLNWFASILMLVLLVVLGRAPAGMVCEYQANTLLAAGNYEQALGWLDRALALNPALNQVAYYHIERGQALYFLRPDQQSDDSHAYLAFTYREKGDYLDAYQELLAVWHSQHTSSWVVSEVSITLERLSEDTQKPRGQGQPTMPLITRLDNDDSALPWLQLLTQVDSTNVYGHYVIGRIQYDLHNYTTSIAQMSMVIQLSSDSDVQSSAYTYMALSDAGQGDYVDERALLFQALQLDPNYRNSTAREEMSGLR
jgi:tetratricopeptide (TPR) repeat protein